MACVGESAQTHSLKYTQYASSINIGGKLGRVEAHLHVALCREVVNFIGTYLTDDLHEAQRIAKVGIVKVEVRVTLKMSDTLTKVYRRTTNSAMHLIALAQQEL